MLSESILEEPYPNPFNAQATVRFGVQAAGQVEVGLYNTLGQRVRLLYHGMAEAGEVQEIAVDAEGLPNGSYFVRLQGAELEATRQVTLVR